MRGFNLSEWALRHQVLTLYLMGALLVAGVFAYFKLGRAEDPDFTVKVMVVRTLWPGATAAEVEQQVTDRIEKKLQETPWLDHVRSYSKPGESMVFVTLKDSTQPKQVPGTWYEVRKKVGDIRDRLPVGVRGPYFNDEFGDTFGTIYAFTSDGFTHAELKDVVEDVRQTLLRLPDVSKVELVGVQDEKIFIELSHKKLATLNVDPLLIFTTLREQNTVAPAGSVETASDRIQMRVTGDFESIENVREIGIRANGRLFRLGDIAHVYRGYVDPPTTRMRYRGEEAIGLAISMASGGNVLDLGENLARAVATVKARLPVGIDMYQVADQPQVVKRSVNEFMQTLLEALVIVLAVSFVSLGVRAGMVVALSIPLVLAVTFLFMLIFGIALQRISLGALIIALGLLVDDAIISTEMMVIKMEQGWERNRAASFAFTSTALPMLTGTLVTAAGFIPVGFARSAAGEYTFSIFAVVVTALLVSWIAAVVFTPVIGFRILPGLRQGWRWSPRPLRPTLLPAVATQRRMVPRAPQDGHRRHRDAVARRARRIQVRGAAVLSVLEPSGTAGGSVAARRCLDARDAGRSRAFRPGPRRRWRRRHVRGLRGRWLAPVLSSPRPAAQSRQFRAVRGGRAGQRSP